MKNFKTILLTATIVAGVASPAYAQFAFPTVELDGAGASTVADIVAKSQNCIGVDKDRGKSDNNTSTVVLADYSPTTPALANPSLTCTAGDDVYNAGTTTYSGLYVSTGSGFGKEMWRKFSNRFDGTAGKIFPTTGTFAGVTPWTNLQYALSESPVVGTDTTDYNAAGQAFDKAGPGIQFPLYVVPVTMAYNQSYGKNAANQVMNFNNKFPVTVNGVAAGGLRLKKATYCAIWNGTITNWNDKTLIFGIQVLNGNQPLFDPITDNATRWTADGAPIRLIGRADRSGATDVFTRALSAQCSGTKFLNAAESLPFDYAASGNVDATQLNSGTNYKNVSYTAARFAGSTNSISTYGWDKNGVSCLLTAVTAGVCAAGAVANTPGLIMVADGSGNVEKAIKSSTGTALVPVNGANLDGKLGYIGADFIAPTPGKTLFAAALQIGTGAGYAFPSAINANAAFGTVFAPQSTAASGAYNPADARQVWKDLTATSATYDATKQETVDRTKPAHWVNILYPAPFDSAGTPVVVKTLANPAAGYPVTGVANLLTYTCFTSSAKVHGVANFVGYLTGKVVKKNAIGGTPASISLSANTFAGTAPATLGILPKANIATIPPGWRTAVNETFLQRKVGALGALNLWIQSAQPTTATGAGATSLTVVDAPANANPNCSGKPGA